jgi:hypothetical protein
MVTHLMFVWAEDHVQAYCRRRWPSIGENIRTDARSVSCTQCLRESAATDFSKAEHARVLAQGWLLGERAIERDDDATRFADDDAAAAYVQGRADAGCRLAQKALRYYGVHRRRGGAWGSAAK